MTVVRERWGREHVRFALARARCVVPHVRRVPEPQELRAVREPTTLGREPRPARPADLAGARPGRGAALAARHRRRGAPAVVRLRRLDRAGARLAGGGAGVVAGRARRRVVRDRGGGRLGARRGDVLRAADARPGLRRPAGVRGPAADLGLDAADRDDRGPVRRARRPVRDRCRPDDRRLRVAARGDLRDGLPDGGAARNGPVAPGRALGLPGADRAGDRLPRAGTTSPTRWAASRSASAACWSRPGAPATTCAGCRAGWSATGFRPAPRCRRRRPPAAWDPCRRSGPPRPGRSPPGPAARGSPGPACSHRPPAAGPG